MSRRAYRIIGRVQGVGFRWFVRTTASELGLAGTVRNMADGTVEVVAEGEEEALDALEAKLRKGPPASHVHEVELIPPPDRPLPYPLDVIR